MKQKRGAFTLFVEVQSDLTEEACASSTPPQNACTFLEGHMT